MSLCTACRSFCREPELEDNESVWSLDPDEGLSSEPSVSSILLLNDQYGTVLHSSWDSFLTSLDQECPICWTLWRHMRSSPLADPVKERQDNFETRVWTVVYRIKDSRYRLRVQVPKVRKEFCFGFLSFYVWKTTKKYFLETEALHPVPNVHTPESMARLIRKWTTDCVGNHAECSERRTPNTEFPTRLVDIGSKKSREWKVVQVGVDTKGFEKYVALSHRWAESTPKLLAGGTFRPYSTYEDHKLPQHYRDIISICRAISIRYLWIDSLCIFQDSDEDFLQEAGKMASIYENAFLTYSICWDFSYAGLFNHVNPRTIPLPLPDGYQGSRHSDALDTSSSSESYAFTECDRRFDIDVTFALINRRGWVVQERFLSPRLVYLGNEQMYWECDKHIACETVPQGLQLRGKRGTPHYTDVDEGRHISWAAVVETYSCCELTRKEDRMIAISGLARSLAQRSGHTYFSGIWIEYWIPELLWRLNSATIMNMGGATSEDESKIAPKAQRGFKGPSWSWASFSCKLFTECRWRSAELTSENLYSFARPDVFPLAILNDCVSTAPSTSGVTFNSFEGSRLEISCFLIPIVFGENSAVEQFSSTGYSTFFYCFENDSNDEGRLTHLRLRLTTDFERIETAKTSHMWVEFSQTFYSSLSCFLVPLITQLNDSSTTFHEMECKGIIVQKIYEDQDWHYIRIGIFTQFAYNFGFGSIILNTVVKEGLRVPETSRSSKENAFEANLCQYASTKISSGVFLAGHGRREWSWSRTPCFSNLYWGRIILV